MVSVKIDFLPVWPVSNCLSLIYSEHNCWYTCNHKSVIIISITSVTLDLPDKMG